MTHCVTPGKYISQYFVNTLGFTKTKKCVFLSLSLQGNNPPSPAIQTPARKPAACQCLFLSTLNISSQIDFIVSVEREKNLTQPT